MNILGVSALVQISLRDLQRLTERDVYEDVWGG